MRLSSKEHAAIRSGILSASILAWIVLLFNPGHITGVAHCHVSDSGLSVTSLQMLLKMNPLSSLLGGWTLMVVAMMLPKLIMPIQHIFSCSFKRCRLFSTFLFLFGYVAVWTIAGIFMIAVMLGLHLMMPSSFLPLIGLCVVAMIWQFSPIKQRCLNQGHDHRILAGFGWNANRDALVFGLIHGVWCVGSGWALMLLPMLLPTGHNISMILLTFIMLSEHLEHPQVPTWRIDFRAKLFRIFVAQARIKLAKISSSRVVYL